MWRFVPAPLASAVLGQEVGLSGPHGPTVPLHARLDKGKGLENATTLFHLVGAIALDRGYRPKDATPTRSALLTALGAPGGPGISVPPTALKKVLEHILFNFVIESVITRPPLQAHPGEHVRGAGRTPETARTFPSVQLTDNGGPGRPTPNVL
ncbi:hypothetical protein GDO78_014876 [Eleutherodactylus coqui]|uniref:Uncharacterized protein n=1 Tax=Eleutherodactylus coqui TaxID=57060 RepID=A0A8J6C3P4_ELECQ|nr:hypothetical protein GDO78_014876 [Eleutherodactylus coqui]